GFDCVGNVRCFSKLIFRTLILAERFTPQNTFPNQNFKNEAAVPQHHPTNVQPRTAKRTCFCVIID
ncbi:MAG: hypothetical protein ACKPB3_08650, partial [Bacteroidota bacterium]